MGAISWPAIVLCPAGTSVEVSEPAARLLGFAPRDAAELEADLIVLGDGGEPLDAPSLPWRRAARGEHFEERQTWIHRSSRSRLPLRVSAYPMPGLALLALSVEDPSAEQRSEAFLRALADALAVRDSSLSLHEALRQLAQHACELTGAKYGAIGALDADGATFRDFVYVGLSEAEASRIGGLPAGKGLLGAVVREERTIRLAELGADPRSAGFPANHPPMRSFLGTPLRIGGEVFGNFYLGEKEGGAGFTEADARALERFSEQASATVALARQKEQEQHRLFEALLKDAPHAIVYFPADSRGEPFGNPAAVRMLGQIVRAGDPRAPFEILLPDGHPIPPESLPSSRALAGESVLNFEGLIVRGGKRTHALASAAPVLSGSGTIMGAVVVFQDITPFRELERLREELAAMVAHDLRNPLQALLLQLEVLLGRAEGEITVVSVAVLHRMQASAERLNRLIVDLLDASRIEGGSLVVECRPVCLSEMVSALLNQIAVTLRGHPVEVEVREEPPHVLADRARLEQVLANLLENSAKYSEPGASIRVVLARSGEGVAISVHDRGPGLEPHELERIFERFYQTPHARRQRSGAGLGLYIAKGLVEAQGGTIVAESVPGEGTIFRVWLPRATPAA